MWDIMFIMLFLFAIILVLFTVANEDHPFWGLVSSFLSSIIFLILSLTQLKIEIPYEIFNATSGYIETGIHFYTSPISPFITYLFFGIFVVLQIYTWATAFSWVRY